MDKTKTVRIVTGEHDYVETQFSQNSLAHLTHAVVNCDTFFSVIDTQGREHCIVVAYIRNIIVLPEP